MNRSTRSIRKSVLCVAAAVAAAAQVFAQGKAGVRPDTSPDAKTRISAKTREERFLAGRDRIAKEQYETKAAALALRIDEAAATSRENAALLYHHALLAEQRAPGIYGISAPPQLLERAQQACDQYLQSALQIMKADLPYRQKHAQLQAMVDSLDDRATADDPIALLSEAPKVVELYHRLLVRNAVYDNLVTAAIEILLVKARTGQLPRVLPPGVPKDLYTNKGFGYERTGKGFLLRFDPDNLSRIQVRQFEFKTPDSGS